VRAIAGFVFASWAHDRGVALAHGAGEGAAGVALVAVGSPRRRWVSVADE